MTRLIALDRTNADQLLNWHGALTPGRQVALKHWLRRYYAKTDSGQWMRAQRGWPAAVALIASSAAHEDFFDAGRIIYCGTRSNRLCERPDFCRRCALDKRIEPAWAEYGTAFPLAKFWYAAVFGSEIDPGNAGLKYGRPPRFEQTWFPYAGAAHGVSLSTWPEHGEFFSAMAELPFALCGILRRHGVIDGALCHLEPHVSFRTGPCGVYERVLPHCNVLLNSSRPIDFTAARQILRRYELLFAKLRSRPEPFDDAEPDWLPPDPRGEPLQAPAWPDIWIDGITSQSRLNGWVAYMLKSWRFERWYQVAQFSGRPRAQLNQIFDRVVFESLRYLCGHNFASANLRSPRRCGNLCCTSTKPQYIGVHGMKLTREQIKRWLKDKSFAAANPEWVFAVDRYLVKKELRKGRRARLDNGDLVEAA